MNTTEVTQQMYTDVNISGLLSTLTRENRNQVPQSTYTILAVILSILDTVAICGNLMVFSVLFKERALNRPINLFILNLAVSDFSVAIFGYPLTIISAANGRWIFGDVGCKMYAFVCYTFSLNSLLTHVMISHYRYTVMCNYKTKKGAASRVFRVLIVGWVYGLFWAASPLLGWSSYVVEPWPISCSINWTGTHFSEVTYVYCVTIFTLLVPLALMIISYIKIAKQSKRMKNSKDGQTTATTQPRYMLDIQKRVTWICFLMTFMFMITWLPYAVVSLCSAHGVDIAQNTVGLLPTLMVKASCSYNPLIYCLTNSKFRKMLRHMFCKRLFRKVTVNSTEDIELHDNVTDENSSSRYGIENLFTITSLRKFEAETSFIANCRSSNSTLKFKPRPAVLGAKTNASIDFSQI